MVHRLQPVPVRIDDERRVVPRVVAQPNARRPVVGPTRRDRRTPSALTVAELAERWYLAECERRGPRP